MDYTPYHRETGQWLRESPQILEIVRDAAERGAEFLRSIAPVDTGDYLASIHVETGMDLFLGDRQAAFVVATSAHAAALEFPHARGGRPRTGAPRPLARSLGFLDGGG